MKNVDNSSQEKNNQLELKDINLRSTTYISENNNINNIQEKKICDADKNVNSYDIIKNNKETMDNNIKRISRELSDNKKKIIISDNQDIKKNNQIITNSYFLHIHNNIENKLIKHKNNRIDTTKYSLITFLPKALLFQFMRLANIYFLVIAIIQCIPAVSPLSPSTAIAPIAFVLCVSIIREGLEDYARYSYDKATNNEKVKVFRNGKWNEITSEKLEVGEIIAVNEEMTFPADLVVLDSSAKEGICYIETATLDGEKTLKFKKAHQKIAGKFRSCLDIKKYIEEFKISGNCECDKPSENLFVLNGSLKIHFENSDLTKTDKNFNPNLNKNISKIKYSSNENVEVLDRSLEKNKKSSNNFQKHNNDNKNQHRINTEMENLKIKNQSELENGSSEGKIEIKKMISLLSLDYHIPLKGESLVLDPKQLLLKGAILKNTEWIIGMVVYTGHNTKLMLNSKKGKVKYSNVEKLMSKFLIAVLILQSILCIICAILYGVFYNANVKNNPFLNVFSGYLIVDSVLNYFTYLLLLNTMIPISLIISLEMAKIVQGYFITLDVKLYSKIRNKFCKAGSVSLNEELGQVDYIFSDKTGTLTCNKMKFKFCVVADVCYQFLRNDELEKLEPKTEKNLSKMDQEEIENEIAFREKNYIKQMHENHLFDLRKIFNNIQNSSYGKTQNQQKNFLEKSSYPNFILKTTEGFGKIMELALDDNLKIQEEFFKALALNNECVISNKKGFNEYSGLNPDDIELVSASKMLGCELEKSESTREKKLILYDEIKTYEILNVIEFTSERKKSSIFIRDGNFIKMYIKGADSEMLSIISKNSPSQFTEQAKNFVNLFSKQGYRTLIVGMRIFEDEEFKILMEELTKVRLSVAENKNKLLKEIEEKFEKDVYCLGATIVEDRLQDFVPETIRDLRLAGIKIWMLTGDKIDTAENIGKSCNLISEELKIFKITNEPNFLFNDFINKFNEYLNINKVTLDDYEESLKSRSQKQLPEYSIMIDLKQTTQDLKKESYKLAFVKISKYAKSVICSRCSPNQKSEVVKLIKESDRKLITLSIGDGGNDVPMITEAHIGIGVYGEEGVMAVQSSDFAIGEFKFLRRLLLFHGRTNYVRIVEMILYFFYKNFVFTITHFYFGFSNNFSGQTIIDDWFISLYNMIFTAFPLGARAVSDHDIHPKDGKMALLFQPFLYEENRRNPIFNLKSFILELVRGMLHGLVNYLILYFVLIQTSVDSEGNIADMWYFSVNCFTNIIFIVSLNLIIKSKYLTPINIISIIFLSWVLYFAFVFWVHFSNMFNSNSTMFIAFSSSSLYLTWLLILTITAAIDFCFYSAHFNFLPSTLNILIKERKENGKINTYNQLPQFLDPYLYKLKQFETEKIERIASPIMNKNNKNLDPTANEAQFPSTDFMKKEIQTENQINTYRIHSIHLKGGEENPSYDPEELNKKLKN